MSHGTYAAASKAMYERIMSHVMGVWDIRKHIISWVMSHESWHHEAAAQSWVMSHRIMSCMSHGTSAAASRAMYPRIMSNVMGESCHICKQIMSHMYEWATATVLQPREPFSAASRMHIGDMRHVTRTSESCHTYMNESCHIYKLI